MTQPSIFFEEVNERQGAFHRRAILLGAFAGLGLSALGGRLAYLTATIPLVYLLGRETVGRTAGALGAAVLAASPFSLYYGVEARPYATLAIRYDPTQTPADAALIRAQMAVYKKDGLDPLLWPRNAGSYPGWVFTSEPLKLASSVRPADPLP